MTDMMDGPPRDPLPLSDEICKRAYVDLIGGIAEGSIFDINLACYILTDSKFPWVWELPYTATVLEKKLLEPGADNDSHEDLQTLKKNSFALVVRSYVYSGLELDTEKVLTSAQLLDFTNNQLRDIVLPTKKLLSSLGNPNNSVKKERRQERKDLRKLGRQALFLLDVEPMFMKVISKIRAVKA